MIRKTFLGLLILFVLALTRPALAEEKAAPKSASEVQKLTAEYNAGHYQEAVERSLQVLAREPNNLTAHYILGNIYVKLGGLESATEHYRYCCQHGSGTVTGAYAREALAGLQQAGKQPVRQAPSARPFQITGTAGTTSSSQTDSDASGYQAQSRERIDEALAAKRRTMEAEIQSLRDQENEDVADIPIAYLNARHSHKELDPDYVAQIQEIKDSYETKIKLLEDDFHREESKLRRPTLDNALDQGQIRP